MNITQLQKVMPHAQMAWALALLEEMPRWNIDVPAREAAFIGTVAVESLGLTRFEENLNYTDEKALNALFRKHWDGLDMDDAWGYLRQPERIANRVYASRMGNGAESSGDGWLYRGRGPIQRTGRAAYIEDSKALGYDLMTDPDALARVPKIGCASSCRFFMVTGCNELADAADIKGIRHKVNGGDNGLQEVIHATAVALKAMAA